MNHIANSDHTDSSAAVATTSPRLKWWLPPLVATAYSLVLYSGRNSGLVLTFGSAIIAYVTAIFLYAMIARLAFHGRNRLLVASGALGIIVAVALTGTTGAWITILGWLTILGSAAVSGYLARRHTTPHLVYIGGAVVVTLLALAQHLPVLSELMLTAQESFAKVLEDARVAWQSLGMTETMIQQNIEAGKKLTDMMVRLIPGFAVLGTLAQFSVGYLVFAGWLSKHAKPHRAAVPFVLWRVPFFAAAPLVLFILLRLTGADLATRIADNALVILSVYYAVCGLALVEFYMQRYRISCLLKGGIYLLLFISQIVGYFATVLLGFIDSYKDWRSSALAADASA